MGSFGKKGGWVRAEGLFRGDLPRLVSQLVGVIPAQFAGFTVIERFVRLARVIFVIVERFEVAIDTFLRIDTLDRGTGNAFIVVSPIAKAVPGRTAPIRNLCRADRKQRRGVDKAIAPEMLDERGAGLPDLRSRQNRRFLAASLQRRTRQAGEKVLGSHIGEIAVGADRLTGKPGDKAAIGPVLTGR